MNELQYNIEVYYPNIGLDITIKDNFIFVYIVLISLFEKTCVIFLF